MTYQEAIDFLFSQRPAFERQGAEGYKPGLDVALDLARRMDNPQRQYPSVHVAGTNGKGSVSHMLATVLQSNGYRVGLFTSPHFVDFRERIRVDGEMIAESEVIRFVEEFQSLGYEGRQPSFFELTSTLAFRHFADRKVDVAVIEVGLGGRLDSTNIITPALSVITNVSLDHTDLLGGTVSEIAREKAGIIKEGIPVVVGEAEGSVREVLEQTAAGRHAPVVFATDLPEVVETWHEHRHMVVNSRNYGVFASELNGDYQQANVNTVLVAADVLRRSGWKLRPELVAAAFNRVTRLTHLAGRWQVIADSPLTICDSGHNPAALAAAMGQLRHTAKRYRRLRLVLGFMADKDVGNMLTLLPREAEYYFTQASSPRALPAGCLAQMAAERGLSGEVFTKVEDAYQAARTAADADDCVYVGGSMYVLAELFSFLERK